MKGQGLGFEELNRGTQLTWINAKYIGDTPHCALRFGASRGTLRPSHEMSGDVSLEVACHT